MGALTARRAVGLLLAALVWLIPSRVLAQSETTEYYGLDTTGSVRVVFDAAGTVLTRVDYGPFGEQLAAAPGAPNEKYAGLFRDDETGLDYAQARQYNPRIGRFTSLDPVYSGLFEPQRWNRYAYALNSPLTLVDPEGLQADSGQKCTSTSVAVEGGYVETVNCTTSSVGGMGIGGVLAWLGGRLADTFTGAVPVGGPEADLLPIRHSGFRPSPAVERVVDVAIAAVAVVAVVKSAAASAAIETVTAKTAAGQPNRIYSARELFRRAEESGPFHNFPESFNQTIFEQGKRTVTPNFFNVARPGLTQDGVMYRLGGNVNGLSGTFEIGVRPSLSGNTEVIGHRFFRPGP